MRRHAHLPTEPLLDAILEDVEHFSGTKEFEDDVCLVGVEVERVGLPV